MGCVVSRPEDGEDNSLSGDPHIDCVEGRVLTDIGLYSRRCAQRDRWWRRRVDLDNISGRRERCRRGRQKSRRGRVSVQEGLGWQIGRFILGQDVGLGSNVVQRHWFIGTSLPGGEREIGVVRGVVQWGMDRRVRVVGLRGGRRRIVGRRGRRRDDFDIITEKVGRVQ